MTVENVRTSIERALAEKPDEPIPRISKREAQHMVKAAVQGSGPDPMLEPVYVAAFAVGASDPRLREMVEGADVDLPDFGTPGRDYRIDDNAMQVFQAFFRKHAVPLGEAREPIVGEMKEQLLNLGRGRSAPAGTFYRVSFDDHRNDSWTGHIDGRAKVFYIEKPEAGKRGGSIYYGAFRLDRRMDTPGRSG